MPEQIEQNNVALIVAAGRGQRVGGSLPKQYLMLGGKTVLRRTIEAFLNHPEINAVLVVIHPDDLPLYTQAVKGLNLPSPVHGGETRQMSVLNGLNALEATRPTNVLIHDAARPFVSSNLISLAVKTLRDREAVLPALQVSDTLKRAFDGQVSATVEREDLWRAQTPQCFSFPSILAAHQSQQDKNLTDDCAVAEAAGIPVTITPGSEENFKITTSEDMERAKRVIADQIETRIGSGFDVHRFCKGSQVTLCGILIPHDKSLKGHSDADVAMHALTDALLGSMALGDIGQHFPPSDNTWMGVDSKVFLVQAKELVAQSGGEIGNIDLTIICEKPKIAPHSHAMRANIAAILDLSLDRVSIKATTTEGLGFTGRNEGIAAQATVSVRTGN